MKKLVSAFTIISLAAAPAAAGVRDAAFASACDRVTSTPSLFAGVTYRIGFDRRASMAPERATLNVGGMVGFSDSSNIRIARGLEITGGTSGKPTFLLAGQDVGRLKEKAELNGSGTAFIVGGLVMLVVIGGLLALDAHRDNKCSDGPDECT